MFLWLTLRLPTQMDSFELIEQGALPNGVLAIPGSAFMPNNQATCSLRVSFSLIPETQMDEACTRLAKLVRGAWAEAHESLDACAEAFSPTYHATSEVLA